MPFKRLSTCGDYLRLRLMLAAAMLCALASPVMAQSKVLDAATLTATTDSISLNNFAIIQADPEGKVTPETIRSTNAANLAGKMHPGDMVYLGHHGTPTWLTVKIRNIGNDPSWVIDLGHRGDGRIGVLQSAHVYELTIANAKNGEAPGLSLNEIAPTHTKGIFRVDIGKDQEKLILFNLAPKAGMPAVIPLKIYSQNGFLEHVQKRSSINTLYTLLLGGMGLYLLSLAFQAPRRSYAVFGAYFLYGALCWGIYDSLGANVGISAATMFLPLMMLGLSLFAVFATKVYCGIEASSYSEKYILYGLVWFNIVTTALAMMLPYGGGFTHMALTYGAPILTMTVMALMSLAQVRSGLLRSHLFFLSWIVPLTGFIMTTLCCLGLLPQYMSILNLYWYSLIPQGVLVIFCLHERLKDLEENVSTARPTDILNLQRLKETKDTADHTRLLKVIEREREMLAEFRTREAQRTEDMRHAKEAADEANRAKSAFLAVVSHEIRTPMTGIMGMVKLLLESNISRQQRDYALTIQESSEAMLALLNDILDFEKIQRGKIELENISFDMHRLIQGVITLMSGHAAEKGISLSARMDEDIPKFVKGDPTRLRQVLLNMMGNAIKFTQKGGVTLLVKNLNPSDGEPNPAQKYSIYFAVQDSGIGIPADAQKNLFNPFAQANSSIARKFGGSGLGLAISKGLIERMGSSININSKEGEGSTFFFTLEMEKGLSIAQEAPRRLPEAAAVNIPPISILVVDDNAINRKVIIGFLEAGRHSITECSSADQALEKINRHAFDLVLMDIELPGIKGNEATKILREHQDKVKAQIPVIAMTGNIDREQKERYLADGMNGFIAKPIEPEKLRAIVAEVAMKSFEREIKGPSLAATAMPYKQPETVVPALSHSIPVQLDGVFNPDMLQSLKDTLGAGSLEELLHDLIVKTEEILAAMDMATQANDLGALAARAHELKGMAGNFGLVEISALAAQAEKKAKGTEAPDGLDTLVKSLPEASLRAKTALKDWIAR